MDEIKQALYNDIFDLLTKIEEKHPDVAEDCASIGLHIDYILD